MVMDEDANDGRAGPLNDRGPGNASPGAPDSERGFRPQARLRDERMQDRVSRLAVRLKSRARIEGSASSPEGVGVATDEPPRWHPRVE